MWAVNAVVELCQHIQDLSPLPSEKFPSSTTRTEVRHYLPGARAEVKMSPYLWHPSPGIPSCVPSIASHLLVLTGLGFHFKRWHKLTQSVCYALHGTSLPSPSHCLPAPRPLHFPPASPAIQQPRKSPEGTTQRWQLLSALAALVQRSSVRKFYRGTLLLTRCKSYK